MQSVSSSASGTMDQNEIIHSPILQPIVVCARLSPEQILFHTGKYLGNKETTDSQGHASSSSDDKKITLLSLNDDVFQEILSHLSYDEIAKLRLVGRHFNEVCQKMLNKGFLSVRRSHSCCLKEMKAKLPRKESERRAHPLASHIHVLTSIELSLNFLSMAFEKYINDGMFCFIPGKVLDECYRLLREIVVLKNISFTKSYELLQEFTDISSMAMEHFEEHILPTMKRNQMINTAIRNSSPRFNSCDTDAADNDSESGIELVVQQNHLLINSQERQIVDLKTKVTEYGRKIAEQGRKIAVLERQASESSRRFIQLERKISNSEAVGVHVQPVVTPPPSSRKRKMKELNK
ncbi:F-box only protein 28-like isoform X2 [Daphnia pulicaria]|uniref:F-box only protein 28-like isoform X2 n=1 Tax=Daphnia pulicaria TaxID=35523 RepID=UPI001EEA6EF6|nr:F-box only protein 28-like isoform X2 [Daphnia pulicaria]